MIKELERLGLALVGKRGEDVLEDLRHRGLSGRRILKESEEINVLLLSSLFVCDCCQEI